MTCPHCKSVLEENERLNELLKKYKEAVDIYTNNLRDAEIVRMQEMAKETANKVSE